MRTSALLLITFSLLSSCAAPSPSSSSPVKTSTNETLDFRLASLNGGSRSLRSFRESKTTYFIAFSTACNPDDQLKRIRELSQRLPDTVTVALINPETERERPKLEALWNSPEPKPEVLLDPLQIVSPTLGFSSAGDYVVADPREGRIVERGHLDLPTPCEIRFQKRAPDTFIKSFADPFARACLRCHAKAKSIMFFDSLEDVLGWSDMAQKAILTMRMPGGPDPYFGKSEVSADPEDLRKILLWLKNPPKIEREDFTNYSKIHARIAAESLGPPHNRPPDLTFELKNAVVMEADQSPLLKHLTLSNRIQHDLIVEGLELQTNTNIVHHIDFFYSPFPLSADVQKKIAAGDLKTLTLIYRIPQTIQRVPVFVSGVSETPGYRVEETVFMTASRRSGYFGMPKGKAVRIPKGSYLGVQLHLSPSGKRELEKTKVGIYLSPSQSKPQVTHRFSIYPHRLTIPPRQKKFEVRTETPISESIKLLAINTHMHYRGVWSRYSVREPGSTQERVIYSLPFYQIKIQEQWRLVDPVVLKKGSTLITTLAYDNSELNDANPDPDASVPLKGTDIFKQEMHNPRFVYVPYEEKK